MKRVLVTMLLCAVAAPAFSESLSDLNTERLRSPVEQKWGRDPFQRPGAPDTAEGRGKPETPIHVDGIIMDGRRALAILNGEFYRIGDTIENYTVKDISRERVLLERDGKRYTFGISTFTREGGKK